MSNFEVKTVSNDETNQSINCEINHLNEYVLQQIFNYFSIVERIYLSQVCVRWQSIIENSFKCESVLNRKRVLGEKENISSFALKLIIEKCRNVRHIALSGISIFVSEKYNRREEMEEYEDILIPSIAFNCKLLETIDFGEHNYFDKEFGLNAKYFSQVKKIVSQNISESALNCIIDSPNIECIDVTNNNNIDVSSLEFRKLGPNIRELHLFDTESVPIGETSVRDICEGNGKYIKHLSIDITSGNVLQLICSQIKQIQTLKLNFYLNGNACDLKQISSLKDLKALYVNFDGNSLMNGSNFLDLFGSLRKIKLKEMELVLTEDNEECIDDLSLSELSASCCTLEKLVIHGSSCITISGMKAIARINCLKHVDFRDCLSISDQSIQILINSCPLLSHFNLHNCYEITDKTVELVIEKAKRNPNQKFFLDVINTRVEEEIEFEMPSNMRLLFKLRDCIYYCFHGFSDGYCYGDEDYKHFFNCNPYEGSHD